MGYILTGDELPPECGEYSAEVRSESFYLRGEYNGEDEVAVGTDGYAKAPEGKRRHGIHLYPYSDEINQGIVEILLEDIPKIRAVLDAVEAHRAASDPA